MQCRFQLSDTVTKISYLYEFNKLKKIIKRGNKKIEV